MIQGTKQLTPGYYWATTKGGSRFIVDVSSGNAVFDRGHAYRLADFTDYVGPILESVPPQTRQEIIRDAAQMAREALDHLVSVAAPVL